MAALGPLNATPARQPFGVLGGGKIRSLQSVKNRQNALTPSSSSSLKRRHASPENSDSENVDPNYLKSTSKRKRSTFDEDVSMSKPARYSLNTILDSKPRTAPVATPRLDTFRTPSTTPASAPAAAGRSPTQSKRQGLLQQKKRFAPPAFGTRPPSLSITAALSGTLAHKKPKRVRTLEESKAKSWSFDIFEESQEHQDYKIIEWTMTQSANILDISDDEAKAKVDDDCDNKENVDPNAMCMPVTRSMAAAKVAASIVRKDIMSDDTRSPLGDLNPAKYYAEGLDATSVVLVHDDVEEPTKEEPLVQPVVEITTTKETRHEFTFDTSTTTRKEEKMTTAEIGALLMAAAPIWDTETLVSEESHAEPQAESADIEIWESESAKDESEALIGESIFALQEI